MEATGLPADAFTLFSATTREGREEILERMAEALAAPGPADPEPSAAEN
jgi:GTP-binding protein